MKPSSTPTHLTFNTLQRQGVKPVKLYNQAKQGLAKTTEDSFQKVKRNKGFVLSLLEPVHHL
jgi:hypothetical protein